LEKLAKDFSDDLAQKLKDGVILLDEMPSHVADFLASLREENNRKI